MFSLIPFTEKERYNVPALRNEFKALYDRLFSGFPMMFEPYMETARVWGFEVKETEKEVILWAELPGFEIPELNVELKNNRLFVKAAKKPVGKEGVEKVYERYVELPVEVEPAKIVATYRNGVLEIHLPKKEAAKPFCIPVK